MPTMWFGFVGSTARSLSLLSFANADHRLAQTSGSRSQGAPAGHAWKIGVVDAWTLRTPALLPAYPPAAPADGTATSRAERIARRRLAAPALRTRGLCLRVRLQRPVDTREYRPALLRDERERP